MSEEQLLPVQNLSPMPCDGLGRLDRAEDRNTGTPLLVRWLPINANGEAFAKRCREIPTHAALSKVWHIGTFGDEVFVAFDFPAGKKLSELDGLRPNAEALVHASVPLAEAITKLHAHGFTHGELSLDSVIWQDGTALLWDWPLSLANHLAEKEPEERYLRKLAKILPCMCPERARGAPLSTGGDVYSLAALLCIAAGAPVPTDKATLALLHSVIMGEWAPQVPGVFPENVRRVLMRMLSRELYRRPSAAEICDELRQAASTLVAPAAVSAPKTAKVSFVAAPGTLEPQLAPMPLPPVLSSPTPAESEAETDKENRTVQIFEGLTVPITTLPESEATVRVGGWTGFGSAREQTGWETAVTAPNPPPATEKPAEPTPSTDAAEFSPASSTVPSPVAASAESAEPETRSRKSPPPPMPAQAFSLPSQEVMSEPTVPAHMYHSRWRGVAVMGLAVVGFVVMLFLMSRDVRVEPHPAQLPEKAKTEAVATVPTPNPADVQDSGKEIRALAPQGEELFPPPPPSEDELKALPRPTIIRRNTAKKPTKTNSKSLQTSRSLDGSEVLEDDAPSNELKRPALAP